MAARDPELPGLALLLDDAAVASTLRENLPEAGVQGVKSFYIRYKRATNCLVAFELDTAEGPRLAYGRTEHKDDEPKLRKAHAKARSGAVLVEDPAVALLLFPTDRRLRSLAKVMRSPATVLAYKPERRLVVRRGNEVVKAYGPDRFAAARAAAAAMPAGLPMQRCVDVCEHRGLLVFQWVEGTTLDSALGTPDGTTRAAAAVDALRALHRAVPAAALPRRTRAGEAAALMEAAAATGVAGPRVEREARRLAERVAAALRADGSAPVLLHGDFSADQVVAGDDGAVLLDLDAACLGDPRWDLGSVLGDLELRVLEGRLEPAAAVEAAGMFAGDDADAVRPFAAGGLLGRAEPFRRRRPGWAALVEAAVERATALAAARPPAPHRRPAVAAHEGTLASLRRIAPPRGAGSVGPLTLHRAWPRPHGRLLLEYRDERGAIVAAQAGLGADSIADEQRRAVRAGAPAPLVVAVPAGGPHGAACPARADGGAGEALVVLLHRAGSDGQLPELHRLLGQPRARLCAHRAGRRAVVALDGAAPVYVKAVRAGRAAAVAGAARTATRLARGAFSVPAVLAADVRAGTVTCAPLPGRRLTDLLQELAGTEAMDALGAALRALHAAAPPSGVDIHDAVREAELVTRAAAALAPYAPALAQRAARAATAVARRLASLPPVAPVPIHRGLHDKQVLVAAGGELGLLDFDTLALGDSALDVGNLLAHTELRALQGRCSPADAERLAAALLDGYGAATSVRERAAAYAQATRVRLACVYAFRPAWPAVPDALLAAATLRGA